MRKVYCKAILNGNETLYWAYKDDSIKDSIPEIVYKVATTYEMVEVKTDAVFKRWATGFDL